MKPFDTARLVHVFETLCCFVACRGYPPTVRELAQACGRSASNTFDCLKRLRALGLLKWRAGAARTMKVLR